MGIAKKGTRRICVDGIAYRVVSRELLPGLRFVIQAIDRPGAVLILRSNQNYAVKHIKPTEIAKAIQNAITNGWQPQHSGPPVEVWMEFE